MTKNIIVLLRLLEHGEVSTNDFAGLERGNIRHLPRIINDARKHVEIYSEEIVGEPTMEVMVIKYILPKEEEKKLRRLIESKLRFQERTRKISKQEYVYMLKRRGLEW